MRLWIVSSSPTGRVAQRLAAAAEQAGLDYQVVDSASAAPSADQDLTDVTVVARIAPEQQSQVALLDHLAAAGARVINPASAWHLSRDKWQSAKRLLADAVPTPRTQLAAPGAVFTEAAGFGDQAVYKPLDGTHGDGIVVVRLGDKLPTRPGVLQEFIDTDGRDVRLFVVGDRVVAAMQRQAAAGDFRANLHLGATASRVTPTPAMEQIAIQAARSLGLAIAGVDMLPTAAGGQVLEANPSPGLGIEAHSGVDVAGAIMQAIRDGLIP